LYINVRAYVDTPCAQRVACTQVSGGDPIDVRDVAADRVTRLFQIVVHLQPQLEALAGAERACQAHGSVGADAALAEDDLVDAAWRNAGSPRERILADAHRNQEFFEEHLAGMDISQLLHDQ